MIHVDPWHNRLIRYILRRAAVVLLTVIASVYVTILAANLGGHVDKITRGIIIDRLELRADTPEMRALTPEQRNAIYQQELTRLEKAAGLHEPFIWRSFRHLARILTLDWGRSWATLTGKLAASGSRLYDNRLIIADRIPATLLLLGFATLFTFISSLYLGLYLSQNRGRWLGDAAALLSPLSSMPAWFYGVFLVAILGAVLPARGMLPTPPPESRFHYALGVAEHMILPSLAICLSVFFVSVNTWRTYFQIYANEDYVELARAKGLTPALIRRRFILRPALPAVFTGFSLTLLGIWSGSLVLEILFDWPGLGQLYYTAVNTLNTGLVLGLTVVYACFLGITLFILDIAYALVDPRIRIADQSDGPQDLRIARAISRSERIRLWLRDARDRLSNLLTSPRGSPSSQRPGEIAPMSLAPRPRRWMPASSRPVAERLRRGLADLASHPSALVGLFVIGTMICIAIYAVVAIPRDEAIRQWRISPSLELPRNARPVWFNLFTRTKLPATIILDSHAGQAEKRVETFNGGKEILLAFNVHYPYDAFPQELNVLFDVEFDSRPPHVALSWLTPDGREIRIGELAPTRQQLYRFNQDSRLVRRSNAAPPQRVLFLGPTGTGDAPVKGAYRLQISGLFFEEAGDLEARFVVLGQVHGLAGTDHLRRDLMMGLLWGTPTALAFGLLGALLTGIGTLLLAAVGAWFGGALDAAIQRLTEINLALPALPILAMVAKFYTLSIWYLLAAAVLLNIFSSSLKSYRAILLQAKTAPYITAALAYGAGDGRIIRAYLIPRIAQVVIPQMVILAPAYVFLEAALAFLGRSDPALPTWGKIIHDAHVNGALLYGNHYWILLPACLLLLLSLAFALVGRDLERVLDPRLRAA